MMRAPGRLWSRTLQVASWTYRHYLTATACSVMIAMIFFTQSDSPARFTFFVVVLPLAGLGILVCWQHLRFSVVLAACALYLAAMTVASAVDLGGWGEGVWPQTYLSVYILLFVTIVGGLVASHDDFIDRLFLVAGLAAAASAALNIYFFFATVVPADGYALYYYRLVATVGMPSYANSTNISATYAVFCIGTLAIAVRGRLPASFRAALAAAAGVLFVAVLLTQARGAIIAVAVGAAVLVLTAAPRFRRFAAGAAVLLAALAVTVPGIQEMVFVRGLSFRPEVWSGFLDLIAARPWTGYGSFSPIGLRLENGVFLDQAHNLVLSAWFRGGVVSALAMALVLVGGLYWSWRHWRATRQVAPLCVMATIASAGMIDYQLLATYPTWPWVTFWLPFGLCVGAEMVARRGGTAAGPAQA